MAARERPPTRHLVARCPTCERPLWSKQIVKLAGLVPFARRFTEVAFLAETRGPGQGRGWKPAGVLRTLAEVAAVAGTEAVVQLQKIAVQGFERAWLQGLITQADVDRVTAIRSLHRDPDAPKPKLVPMPLRLDGHVVETPAVEPERTKPALRPFKLNFGGR